jgi:hypothetical protein
MACFQTKKAKHPFSYSPEIDASSGGYKTLAECLEACGEGACCTGASCSIVPKCLCQGEGQSFRGVGSSCQQFTTPATTSVEVEIAGVNHVSRYKQSMQLRYPADMSCCLTHSDALLTSYIFAGEHATGVFSLTKASTYFNIPLFGFIATGTWWYSFSNDDITFSIVLYENGVIAFRATSWTAWHWELNPNSWCNQTDPEWNCRTPSSHTARYYGVGERRTAAGDAYELECPTTFVQQCSNGYPSGCYHGAASTPNKHPLRAGRPLAGSFESGAIFTEWGLQCSQYKDGVYETDFPMKYKPTIMSEYVCTSTMPAVFQGGDAVQQNGSTVITIEKVTIQ